MYGVKNLQYLGSICINIKVLIEIDYNVIYVKIKIRDLLNELVSFFKLFNNIIQCFQLFLLIQKYNLCSMFVFQILILYLEVKN